MTTKVSWLVFKHINKYNDSVPGVPVYISPGISSSRTDLHRSFCQLPITEYRTYLPPRSSKLPSLRLLHQYAWATCHDSRGWTLQNQPLSMWIYVVCWAGNVKVLPNPQQYIWPTTHGMNTKLWAWSCERIPPAAPSFWSLLQLLVDL